MWVISLCCFSCWRCTALLSIPATGPQTGSYVQCNRMYSVTAVSSAIFCPTFGTLITGNILIKTVQV
jgi:hypothetical protein